MQIKSESNSSYSQIIWFVGFVLIVVFVRSIFTMQPELGGDAGFKWLASISFATDGGSDAIFKYEHHSSRWGVVVPVAILHKFFGIQLSHYYYLPLVCYGLLFSTLLFWFRNQYRSPYLVVAFAIILFYEPIFFRASTQLQPYVFGAVLIAGSIASLIKYVNRPSWIWLIIASLLAFLAYSVKETYVFFYPGLFCFLWLKSNLRIAVLFSALVVVWLIVETLSFNAISNELTWGRIEFILADGTHLKSINDKYPEGVTWLQMITTRWIVLENYAKVLHLLVGIYIFWLIITKRLFSLDFPTLAIILVTVSYIVFVTIIPKQLSPLQPLQPLFSKYLMVITPFMVYIFMHGVCHVANAIPVRYRVIPVSVVSAIAAMILILDLIGQPILEYSKRTSRYPDKQAFLWRHDEIRESFLNGSVVCWGSSSVFKGVKTYFTYFVYPQLVSSDFRDSEVTDQLGEKVKVFYHKDTNPNTPTSVFTGRELEPIESIEMCPRR